MSMEPEDEICDPRDIPFESEKFVRCPVCGHMIEVEKTSGGFRDATWDVAYIHCGRRHRAKTVRTVVYISPKVEGI